MQQGNKRSHLRLRMSRTHISLSPHFLQPSFFSISSHHKISHFFSSPNHQILHPLPRNNPNFSQHTYINVPPTCSTSSQTNTMDIQRKSSKGKGRGKGGDESLKVVYISTPMKVRTSASRFRSLVQQLTGKNSDIAPYLDSDEGVAVGFRDEDGMLLPDRVGSSVSSDDASINTPATSESLLGTVDNVFASQINDRFAGILSSELFSDGSQMDLLGSYDDLLI